MNKNFTIPAFAEPITGLPDTPTCAANELKRRFQAPADEVRTAHNALAEAHETLDAKVEGIVTETFAGAIHESMFDGELAEKLNGKADETSVSEQMEAEATAREALETANSNAHSSLQRDIAAKCTIATGTFTATGDTMELTLPFTPTAVVLSSESYDTFMVPQGYKSNYNSVTAAELRGNKVIMHNTPLLNTAGRLCYYLALR